MKGFIREERRLFLCGLNCALCPMHLGGHCPGCGGGPGNQSCAIARCSIQHGGLQFCWECSEYPCHRYEDFDGIDSFIPHQSRQRDIAQVRGAGLEAYLAQLEERRAILDTLLARYDDGRRKGLFLTAVYLLPLDDLRAVLADLDGRPERTGQPVKERALLQAAADRRGVSLKLNKRRKKE